MVDDHSIRDISVDFARTIAQELKAGDGYFELAVYGPLSNQHTAEVRDFTQAGEDMIERYIRRAIERDRDKRAED